MLTAASLVLDWTSRTALVAGMPERMHIIRELIRVTHPQGHLWLTFPETALDADTFLSWQEAFRKNGFAVIDDLSGYPVGTDGPRDFACWSIVVSPNGHALEKVALEDLQFTFEKGRMHRRSKRSVKAIRRVGARTSFAHQQFEVLHPERKAALPDTVAVDRALKGEVRRWMGIVADGHHVGRRVDLQHDRWRELGWRTLVRFHELGITL